MSIGKPLGIIVITNCRSNPKEVYTNMNPMNFLALKPSWEKFRTNHPKMISFVKTASRESFLDEGSLIEIKVTNSSGKTMAANIRVKKDDIEFLGGLKNALEK